MNFNVKNGLKREFAKILLGLNDEIDMIGGYKPFKSDQFNISAENLRKFANVLGAAVKCGIKANPYIINQIENRIKAFSVKKGNCTKEFKCFKLLCKELLVNLESENYDYNSIIHNETGAVIYNFEKDTPEEVFKKLCRILGL